MLQTSSELRSHFSSKKQNTGQARRKANHHGSDDFAAEEQVSAVLSLQVRGHPANCAVEEQISAVLSPPGERRPLAGLLLQRCRATPLASLRSRAPTVPCGRPPARAPACPAPQVLRSEAKAAVGAQALQPQAVTVQGIPSRRTAGAVGVAEAASWVGRRDGVEFTSLDLEYRVATIMAQVR